MELTEEQMLKKSARVKTELSEDDKQYFSARILESYSNSYAKTILSGGNVNVKRDIKIELKHRLVRQKLDLFEKNNSFTFCEKRQKYISHRKSSELIY